MKKILHTIIILFASTTYIFAQTTLSFRITNPQIIYSYNDNAFEGIGGDCVNLQWDVEMKASDPSTRYWAIQILQNYNAAALTDFYYVPGTIGAVILATRYTVTTNTTSGNLNLFITSNQPNTSTTTSRFIQIPDTYTLVGTFMCRITDPDAVAGINFIQTGMNNQEYEKLFATPWTQVYTNPNLYEGIDLTNLYLGRIYSTATGWSQYGGATLDVPYLDWTTAVNTSVWEGTTSVPAIGTSLTSALRIHDGTSLTIPSTGQLTAASLDNNAINGIIIQSEAASTGSLKIDGSITGTGTATVERYIPGYSAYASGLQATHGWHLLSSPVNTFSIAGSSFEPGVADDLYSWNEPSDLWYNYKSSNPSQVEPGIGYLVAYSANATKTFTGVLNASDLPISGLTNTTSAIHKGFNLLGNPFSSALVWNKTGGNWALSGVNANCQVWDEVSASYKVIPPDGIIPAMTGFMVYTTGGGSLTIPKTSQVHSTQAWYKNGQQEIDGIVLVARDQEGQTAQESVIRFNSGATEGYDNEYDSYFLCGFAPQFYSVSGNESYALNTLPAVTDNLAIPFTFVKNGSGTFSIELSKTLPDVVIYLQDNKTNTYQILSENPLYNFTSEEGDRPDRFVLRFGTGFLRVNPANTKANFYIWYNQGNINFSSLPEKVLSLSIVDMAGREIANLGKPATDKIPVGKNLAPGYYIVKVNTTDAVVARKLYIN